jgi:hypothetical protein
MNFNTIFLAFTYGFSLKKLFLCGNIKNMKKFLSLILVGIAFAGCQEDLKSNNPGLQALKDDVFWRANDVRAYVSASGHLSIEGLNEFEELVLNTNNANPGYYYFGTTDQFTSASYSSNFDDIELNYATLVVPGPVAAIATPYLSGGTGYTSGTGVATSGGSGSGLTVTTTASGGAITNITISTQGSDYVAGDIITVVGGGNNCRFRILNIQGSNGEIHITEFDNLNMTVSGKFKFNAVNTDGNPAGGPIVNYQYGEFYRVPVYPSL